MNILFWNLKGNNLHEHIKRCLIENNVNVAVFAEYKGMDFRLLSRELNDTYQYIEPNGGCDKIAMFVSTSVNAVIKREQSRYALYLIKINEQQYIFAGVHLQDRHSTDTAVRIETIGRLMNDIKNLEQSSNCNNTIIIGDFNANPYDDELLQMNAFHAVPFKEVIRKSESRTVDGVSYRRLYNPVIHFLSEDGQNYGSFYYPQGSKTPVWHCLDQILLSKALIDTVHSLRYIKKIDEVSLIKKFKPNSDISDHLPLLAELK